MFAKQIIRKTMMRNQKLNNSKIERRWLGRKIDTTLGWSTPICSHFHNLQQPDTISKLLKEEKKL
jgi:hypothetical protein